MGVLMLLAAIVFIYFGKVTVVQSIPLFVLGYAFVMAKDTLLNGLFLGIFKIKDNEK